MWGFNTFTINRFELRFESNLNLNIKDLPQHQWIALSTLLSSMIPKKSSIKRRMILNIYLLDIVNSYKGWRHYKGLPVRGQRTWTNAWSTFRSNTILRQYKIKLAKKFYGNLPSHEVAMALAAEQINLCWKIQWFEEWYAAKRNMLTYKGAPNTMKVDLYSMANGQIINPIKLQKMTKKQRQSFQKNHFSLGFDPGFTKPLLRELYKSRVDPEYKSDIQSKLLFKKQDFKKKKVKKKVDERARIMAHDAKKKKKKSVW